MSDPVLKETPAPESFPLRTAPAGIPSPAHSRVKLPWFRLRQNIPSAVYKALVVFSFIAFLGTWWWLSHQSFVNQVFVPSPEKVWDTGHSLLADESIWMDLKISLFRVTAGFLLAVALALPIGIWLGSYKAIEGLLQPLIEFIRYVPVPALIPLLMLCFGIGEMAKVMLIFVGTFFQLVLMVADEVRRVPYELLQVSYTLGAKRGEVMNKVLFRAALPGIFDALRLCNGWAWTYLVVAELIAANEGLGYRILKFSRFLQTPKIFVYLVLLGVVGLFFDFLFRKFNARMFRWADTSKR
jgi:NitT/TauT family transport system permease protein